MLIPSIYGITYSFLLTTLLLTTFTNTQPISIRDDAPNPDIKAPDTQVAVAPEGIRLSHNGLIVNDPIENLYVYYDDTRYDPTTIQVSISEQNTKVNCQIAGTNRIDHVVLTKQSCQSNIFTLPAEGKRVAYTVKVTVKTKSATTETKDIPVELLNFPRVPWPIADPNGQWPPRNTDMIGNLMENYQEFGGPGYWHNGLDIRNDVTRLDPNHAGEVRSPVDGKVVKIVNYNQGNLYWSFMIQDTYGFVWQFHHVDSSTYRFRVGDNVRKGDIIGSVILWPERWNGANYHHIHLNVAIPHPQWTSIPKPYVDGWRYINPILLFNNGNYVDQNKPKSEGLLYILPNGGSSTIGVSDGRNAPTVSGKIDVAIELSDIFSSPNSVSGTPYPQSLFELAYRIEPSSGTGNATYVPFVRFAQNPPAQSTRCSPNLTVSCQEQSLRTIYKERFSSNGNQKTTRFNYSSRRFYFTVTNVLRGEFSEDGALDTTKFPNGKYRITVIAKNEWKQSLEVSGDIVIKN
ncbi:uncharacterized protein VTP21DRAFT_8887 [Calcarisporiella thermophila]|uniref:uncharacterized protein n=1 Tax=Calcarisporiella thermophila TaxID=911321 RepID=UPI003743815E